ncbi:hypothetical protein HPP92_014198 [Vanilla planifolia]|uniref:Starch synthase, chloroplastic/amyloplastic n=1 Tax=Vanilla planifolia TaxID=51239 RepID=A0A835QTD6_VANPL|nr:hypothetical protein HPP92_014198 [Vanilla planifolia]
MASVSTPRFISNSYKTRYAGGFESDPRSFQNNNMPTFRRKTSNNGLRSQNLIYMLQMGTGIKPNAKKTRTSAHNVFHPRAMLFGNGMKIIFVATEVALWSKTGGLGDVLGGLPPALAANGHRVMTVAPRYDQYSDAWDTGVLLQIKVGDKTETVRFFHCYKRGVDRVFVDHPMYLEKVCGKTEGKIYGPVTGTDYEDNQLRFSLLCLAALEAPRVLNLKNSFFSGPYGEDVVFVANDWHTGPLPCYLKSMYKANGIYNSAKVAFCIHNVAYQGRFAFSDFPLLNLPDRFKASFEFIDGYDKPVKGRKINWLKAGLTESDRNLTVSPHYAKELVSGIQRGVELDNILRVVGISGIVNGMDIDDWNPTTDKYIAANYDAETVSDGKAINKEALQAEVGLPVNKDIPIVIFIGRLEEQKGSDILAEAIPQFIEENVQIIVLGTGKKKMEKQLKELEEKYPKKARGITKFNVPLAHQMFAGGDLIIVPSRFEPCGLVQLQGMQYGTLPIGTYTGGLVDTITDGVTGFLMSCFGVECDTVDPSDVAAITSTVKRALKVYGTPKFKDMIRNCMVQDLSWKGPAKQWEKVLLSLKVVGGESGVEGDEIAPLVKENVATA